MGILQVVAGVGPTVLLGHRNRVEILLDLIRLDPVRHVRRRVPLQQEALVDHHRNLGVQRVPHHRAHLHLVRNLLVLHPRDALREVEGK